MYIRLSLARSVTCLGLTLSLAACGVSGERSSTARQSGQGEPGSAVAEQAQAVQRWDSPFDPSDPNFDMLNVCSMIPEEFWNKRAIDRGENIPTPMDSKGYTFCFLDQHSPEYGKITYGIFAQDGPYDEFRGGLRIEGELEGLQEGFQYFNVGSPNDGTCQSVISTYQGYVGVAVLGYENFEHRSTRLSCELATILSKDIISTFLGNRDAMLDPNKTMGG